jgi:hypothetical protein
VAGQGGLAGRAWAGPHFAVDLALDNVDFVETNALNGMSRSTRLGTAGIELWRRGRVVSELSQLHSGIERVYVRSGEARLR